ncbi:hypothetical protein PG990_008802 [Apiospora arundinis]
METVTPRCRTRLRRACDGCSVAKVKCDRKDLAACDRCQLNEIECTFSVSRRYGKQSWSKRVASQWGGGEPSSAPAARPPGPGGGSGVGRGGSDVYLFSPLDVGDVVFDGAPFWGEDGFNATYGDMAIDMDMASTEHTALPRHLRIKEGLPFGDESTTTATSSLASVSSTASASASMSLPPSHAAPSAPDAARRSSLPHDCEAQALAILQSLQHSPAAIPREHLGPGSKGVAVGYKSSVWPQPPDAGATAPSPSPTTTGTGTDVLPSPDEVLLVNKAALQRFAQLADCPCAVTPHLALLYLALLAKMLFWYREAATGDCVDRLRPTQIRMGMLDLDDEDQASMLRVIILRELRKVEALVERLANLSTAAANEAEGPEEDTDAGLDLDAYVGVEMPGPGDGKGHDEQGCPPHGRGPPSTNPSGPEGDDGRRR